MSQQTLFEAIRNNDAAAVSALLDGDPSLVDVRLNGVSPILFSVYNGHAELARLFVDRGAKVSFAEACALGDEAPALRMLDKDPSLLDAYSEDGFPPLGLAIFFRHPRLAQELIERGANVDAAASNAFRVAPIHAAAAVRDAGMVRLLLARGADANARQQLGYTALHTAAQHGDVEIVELLLAHGADPRIAGDDGKTPADLAEAHGQMEIVKRLNG